MRGAGPGSMGSSMKYVFWGELRREIPIILSLPQDDWKWTSTNKRMSREKDAIGNSEGREPL
jgi:hypothetical protein